jgi:hypothetical protein
MLILPKHSIDKKSIFLPVLPNAYAILKSNDFKNTIFKNTIFKITLIEIALPNGPLIILLHGLKIYRVVSVCSYAAWGDTLAALAAIELTNG